MRFENTFSDDLTRVELGQRLARWRLSKNLTQEQLANEAGVSVLVVKHMEKGAEVKISSLLRVLRALELLPNLDALVPEVLQNPLALPQRGTERVRATGRRAVKTTSTNRPWRWQTR